MISFWLSNQNGTISTLNLDPHVWSYTHEKGYVKASDPHTTTHYWPAMSCCLRCSVWRPKSDVVGDRCARTRGGGLDSQGFGNKLPFWNQEVAVFFFLIMAHICNYLMHFLPKLCLGGPTLQGTEINVLTKLCSSKLHFTINAGHSDFSLFLRTCPEKCIHCSFFLLINEFSFCQKMLRMY